MKTYFKKDETTQCGCMEPKTSNEIFCFSCANYWAANVGKYHLPFKNSNSSVKWMNAMLNDMHDDMKAAEEQLAVAGSHMLAGLARMPCS